MLVSARHQARSSFNLGRSWIPSSPETSAAIAHAEDVAKILRQNVVQGQRVEEEEGSEKYSMISTK
jgi:complex III assembly factor LYRM7